MKKSLLLSLFLAGCLFVSSVFAGTKDLTFTWEQVVEPDLLQWNLYYSETSIGPYILFTNIIYNGSPGPQFSSDPLVFTSPDGQRKIYYFVLTAEDIEGNESGYSNEVSQVIDFEAPGVPFNFTVIVVPN